MEKQLKSALYLQWNVIDNKAANSCLIANKVIHKTSGQIQVHGQLTETEKEREKLGALVDCIQIRVDGKQKKRRPISIARPVASALRVHNGMQVAQNGQLLCSIIQQTRDKEDCHRQVPSYWTNMDGQAKAAGEVAKRPFPKPNLPNNINGSLSRRLAPKNAHTGQGNSGQALLWDRGNNALPVNPSNLFHFGLKIE